MRVGFVTRLLWDRYGPFWRRLLDAAGAETLVAEPERRAALASDPRLDVIAGRAFREAAAEALALAACDRIVVPELNPGYAGTRGSAQDPFVADFPGALAQAVPGLPGLLAVPADLADDAVEGRAVALLSRIVPSPGAVRRVWQTHRADARPPRPAGLPPDGGSGARTVALVGQPWHLGGDAERWAGRGGERLLSAARIAPAEARAEGWRIDPKLAPSDAEALGAVRRLARRPGVDVVRMIVDPSSGADAWLERRARELAARRPFETIDLAERPVAPSGDGTAAG
jgi:hypothetical protein